MTSVDVELLEGLQGFAEQASSQCFDKNEDGLPELTEEGTNRAMTVKLGIITEGLNIIESHHDIEWKQLKWLTVKRVNTGPKTEICYNCGKVISEKEDEESVPVYVDVGEAEDGRQMAGQVAHCETCEEKVTQ